MNDRLKQDIERQIVEKNKSNTDLLASVFVFSMFFCLISYLIYQNYTTTPKVVVGCDVNSQFDYVTKLEKVGDESMGNIQIENILYSFARKTLIALSPQTKTEAINGAKWLISNTVDENKFVYEAYFNSVNSYLGEEVESGNILSYYPEDKEDVIRGIKEDDTRAGVWVISFPVVKAIMTDSKSQGRGFYMARIEVKFVDFGIFGMKRIPQLIKHSFTKITKEDGNE